MHGHTNWIWVHWRYYFFRHFLIICSFLHLDAATYSDQSTLVNILNHILTLKIDVAELKAKDTNVAKDKNQLKVRVEKVAKENNQLKVRVEKMAKENNELKVRVEKVSYFLSILTASVYWLFENLCFVMVVACRAYMR